MLRSSTVNRVPLPVDCCCWLAVALHQRCCLPVLLGQEHKLQGINGCAAVSSAACSIKALPGVLPGGPRHLGLQGTLAVLPQHLNAQLPPVVCKASSASFGS